jgi:REP element-mobilizing transposase RayT
VVIDSWWGTIPRRFPSVGLDAYVVMPNHLHGIVVIEGGEPQHGDAVGVERVSLSRIVQWFKSATTNDYQRGVTMDGWEPFAGRLWQRNYYEHVVRDETDLDRIRWYIMENPARWAEDDENPERMQ